MEAYLCINIQKINSNLYQLIQGAVALGDEQDYATALIRIDNEVI